MTAIHLHRARSTDDVTQRLREAAKRAKAKKISVVAAQSDLSVGRVGEKTPDESFAAMGEADRLEMEERGYGS